MRFVHTMCLVPIAYQCSGEQLTVPYSEPLTVPVPFASTGMQHRVSRA